MCIRDRGLGDLPQDGHGRVGLPPLDLPQHAAGHPGEGRRLLHAQLLALADAADVAGDGAVQFHGDALPKRRKARYLVKILSYHSLSDRTCQGGKGNFPAAPAPAYESGPGQITGRGRFGFLGKVSSASRRRRPCCPRSRCPGPSAHPGCGQPRRSSWPSWPRTGPGPARRWRGRPHR